jgi:hypothetical protein
MCCYDYGSETQSASVADSHNFYTAPVPTLQYSEMGTRYFFRYPKRRYPIPILRYFSKFWGPILDTPILYQNTKNAKKAKVAFFLMKMTFLL